MNPGLARVRAALTKNKAALGALGVVAVGALAWRARSSAEPATATKAPAAASTQGFYQGSGQTSAATGYDSTASDVYNAIQPQLEDLRDLLEQAKSPIPVTVPEPANPAPTTPPAAPVDARRDSIASFYQTILRRVAGTSEINHWDGLPKSLEEIRTDILNQPEAKLVR